MMGKGTKIPIAFTKDADAKDIADAIGAFVEKYDSHVISEITNSEEYFTEKNSDDITKRKSERSKRNSDSG